MRKMLVALIVLIFTNNLLFGEELGYKFYSPTDKAQTIKDKVLVKAKVWNIDSIEINNEGIDIKNNRIFRVVPLDIGMNEIVVKMWSNSKITEKVFSIVRYVPKVNVTSLIEDDEPIVVDNSVMKIEDSLLDMDKEQKVVKITRIRKPVESETVSNVDVLNKVSDVSSAVINVDKTVSDFQGAFKQGKRDANRQESNSPSFLDGYLYSTLLGPAGMAIAYGNSSQENKMIADDYKDKSIEYQNGYKEGYKIQAREINREHSLTGSILGLITFAVIFL